MRTLSDLLTVWTTTRAAGITSYLLLYVSTVAGLLVSSKMASKRAKAAILGVHQWSGWFGFLFGAMHGMVLLFDRYVGYSAFELAVPFASNDHRYLNGIGTLTLYISGLLILSSDLMKKLGKRVWRAIHFLAFAGYGLALLHGLLLGTDSRQGWMLAMYALTAASVLLLTAVRIYGARQKKPSPEYIPPSGRAKPIPLAGERRIVR